MTVTARKYNPGFLTDDELVASFCVRTEEFASMIEALRDSSGGANTHQIVIGPRGSGKTSLLLRVAAEIRRDSGLSARFFPVVFAEESYEVSTAGEFWLECLSRLADQAPRGEDDPDLRHTYDELRQIQDDRTLGDRCLGVLQDFADRQRKRLVVVVENLNMMFGDIGDPQMGWQLRHTLQNDPRFLLLASATSRFDEIDKRDRAFYDLFRQLMLRPLDTDDCAALWRAVSGQDRAAQTIQALRILTGGSPRLLTIVARFGGDLSFRELMADLLNLVDDHTEYFKRHLDALPAQERRVYLALAELWKPATTREISDRARLDTSKCSAHLARLTERGAVEVTGGSPRRKLYYLAERLYNIYYLMRRARGPAPMIEALIRFMEGWYSPDELKAFGVGMAEEASGLDGEPLSLYRTAFGHLLRLPSLEAHREELLRLVPATFVEPAVDTNKSAQPALARELVRKARASRKRGNLEDSVAVSDQVVRRFGTSQIRSILEKVALALLNKGMALKELQQPVEALASWDEVVERFGANDTGIFPQVVASALVCKGALLAELNRPNEALAIWEDVVRRFDVLQAASFHGGVFVALYGKGVTLLSLDRLHEALDACDEFFRRNKSIGASPPPELVADAMVCKGSALARLHQFDKAVTVWDQMVEHFGTNTTPKIAEQVTTALENKVSALSRMDRLEEALVVTDQIMQRLGESAAPEALKAVASALINKGAALFGLNKVEEALKVWGELVNRFGTSESPELRDAVKTALMGKAIQEFASGQDRTAIATVDQVFRQGSAGSPKIDWLAHLIRAQALLVEGEIAACVRDVEAALAVLPRLDAPPKEASDLLSGLAVELGPERMRDLIVASPAADLLLPLTTALELELGEEPRVAKEVEEVAEDIRRDMAERRKAKSA
ncbi:MAG: AAA family ATPase [Rhodospirillaceae bacterium]|nr:AAA family ATPase [Rhodospirillaceae bacterium]MDE0254842.1 AAA family ATPase [Rhodospirillaceae bacterium]MDE0618152.1 AAA family ATPase [Rhodospirillaceae bacterium]